MPLHGPHATMHLELTLTTKGDATMHEPHLSCIPAPAAAAADQWHNLWPQVHHGCNKTCAHCMFAVHDDHEHLASKSEAPSTTCTLATPAPRTLPKPHAILLKYHGIGARWPETCLDSCACPSTHAMKQQSYLMSPMLLISTQCM
jgi:hypothetical protein